MFHFFDLPNFKFAKDLNITSLLHVLLSLILFACALVEAQETYSVFTYAGTLPTSPLVIVNGPRSSASFYDPYTFVFDSVENMYVSEVSGNRIRKISPQGVVSYFLGVGTQSSVDGPLASATANFPHGLAIDSGDHLFFVDAGSHKVRRIDSVTRIVSTFAGSGSTGFANGFGTYATFSSPIGLAIDSNNTLFVGDRDNHAVRKVTSGRMVSTLAGSGSAGSLDAQGTSATFSLPHGVSVDAIGNVLVADKGNNKIRKVSPTGVVATVAGTGAVGTADGSALTATFSAPMEVRQDSYGNIFVSNNGAHSVRKISESGAVTTVFGSGSAISADGVGLAASIYFPAGIIFNRKGFMFVVERGSYVIRFVLICSPVSTGHMASQTCVCNAGYLKLANGTCVIQCPAGTSANVDNTICTPCSAGLFKNSTVSVCTSCREGTEVNADASDCDICAPGRYKPTMNVNKCIDCPLGTEPISNKSACVGCIAGYYRPTFSYTSCVPCPEGSSCTASAISCQAGYYFANSQCKRNNTYFNSIQTMTGAGSTVTLTQTSTTTSIAPKDTPNYVTVDFIGTLPISPLIFGVSAFAAGFFLMMIISLLCRRQRRDRIKPDVAEVTASMTSMTNLTVQKSLTNLRR